MVKSVNNPPRALCAGWIRGQMVLVGPPPAKVYSVSEDLLDMQDAPFCAGFKVLELYIT